MTKKYNYDWDPYNLPAPILSAIGQVNTCFAQTEELLQEAIAGIAGLDVECGLAFTKHMAMPQRLDVLRAVAEIVIDNLDVLDELDTLIARFQKAIEARNAVAHDRWCIDQNNGQTFVSKFSARGSVKVDLVPAPVEKVIADAKFIYDVGIDIFSFIKRNNFVPPITERPNRSHKSKAARKMRRDGRLS